MHDLHSKSYIKQHSIYLILRNISITQSTVYKVQYITILSLHISRCNNVANGFKQQGCGFIFHKTLRSKSDRQLFGKLEIIFMSYFKFCKL